MSLISYLDKGYQSTYYKRPRYQSESLCNGDIRMAYMGSMPVAFMRMIYNSKIKVICMDRIITTVQLGSV